MVKLSGELIIKLIIWRQLVHGFVNPDFLGKLASHVYPVWMGA